MGAPCLGQTPTHPLPRPPNLVQYGEHLPEGFESHLLKAVHEMEAAGDLKHGAGHHTGHYLLTAAALRKETAK